MLKKIRFCTLNAEFVFLTSMFGLDLCQILYQQYNNNNIFTLKPQNTGVCGGVSPEIVATLIVHNEH